MQKLPRFCNLLVQISRIIQIVPRKTTFKNSQKFFNHSQKQPPEVLYKKSFFQTFCDIHRKTPVLGLIFNKVAGHQSCDFKKRLQHRYFFVNIGKFIITPILKNICKRLHFWKLFCKNIFQIRTQQRELFMKQEWSPVV